MTTEDIRQHGSYTEIRFPEVSGVLRITMDNDGVWRTYWRRRRIFHHLDEEGMRIYLPKFEVLIKPENDRPGRMTVYYWTWRSM